MAPEAHKAALAVGALDQRPCLRRLPVVPPQRVDAVQHRLASLEPCLRHVHLTNIQPKVSGMLRHEVLYAELCWRRMYGMWEPHAILCEEHATPKRMTWRSAR